MRPKDALRRALAEKGEPIVTSYSLFRLMQKIWADGEYLGDVISLKIKVPGEKELKYYINTLFENRYLRDDDDFTGYAYRVSDVPDGPAEEITALVDPFCYISHLSAMQRYGLTTRAPIALQLSTPKDWRGEAHKRELQDYGLFPDIEKYREKLRRIPFPEKVRQRPVHVHTTKRSPVIKPIRNSAARIAAIGEVFVQMLSDPELCGGMAHVLEVWTEHASVYLDDIIPAVDAAPEKIVKVRAGYILDERLNLNSPKIENWSRFAQRGGSRLLDPSRPYVSKYSEKWMISLNV